MAEDSPASVPDSLAESEEADTRQTPDARRAEEYLMLPSLEDMLAPASAELTPRWLALGDEVTSVVPIVGYPRYVYPGWFGQIVDLDLPYLEASWHLVPRDSAAMIRTLRRRLTEFDASRRLDARQGRMHDPERELAYQDVAQMIERLQRGEERIFDAALYLLVRAQHHDAELLAQRVRQVESALNTLFLEGRSATFEQDIAFRSCLPLARDELRRTRQLDAATIATAFPFSSMSLSMPEGILYGVVPQNNSLIVLDPFSTQLENANMVVFAKSGAGKSFFCKLLALRSRIMGTSVCIIDPEPLEEYQPLCDAVHGTYIRLAPGAGQRINPFDLAFSDQAGQDRSDTAPAQSDSVSDGWSGHGPQEQDDDDDNEGDESRASVLAGLGRTAENPLAEKIQSLLAFLALLLAERTSSEVARLSNREKGLLDQALRLTYGGVGITEDPTTHHLTPPLLVDLYHVLRSHNFGPGSADLAHSLADRLLRYVEGSLSGLFAAQTNVGLDNSFVVFNIRELESDLRPIGLWLITDFVWTRMRRERGRQPRLLFIDEAWSLVQHVEGGQFLASLARRARKYYLGLITITQDVGDFLGNEYGRTVLSQAAIQLLMMQSSATIDQVVEAFRLSGGERNYVLTCAKGYGLLFARNTHTAIRVEASPFEYQLATTNPRELNRLRMQRQHQPRPHRQPEIPGSQTDRMNGPARGSRDHVASGHEHGRRVSVFVAPDATDMNRVQLGPGDEFTDALLEGATGNSADDSRADVDKGVDGVENSLSSKDERLIRRDRERDDAVTGGAPHLMFLARSNQNELPNDPPAHESVHDTEEDEE
jgi:conjugal transfer ATP-binding protein TraC